MNKFENLNSFLEEKGIIITDNKINIISYTNIDYFDFDKIILTINDKKIVFKGENLVLTKLLNEEIEIRGVLKFIEFR